MSIKKIYVVSIYENHKCPFIVNDEYLDGVHIIKSFDNEYDAEVYMDKLYAGIVFEKHNRRGDVTLRKYNNGSVEKTMYRYDHKGNKILEKSNKNIHTWKYTYYNDSNIIKSITEKFNGITSIYKFNHDGKVIYIDDDNHRAKFIYDTNGNISTCINYIGREICTYNYDKNNQCVRRIYNGDYYTYTIIHKNGKIEITESVKTELSFNSLLNNIERLVG